MEKLYRIYAITSLLFFVVLALSPLKDRISGWRKFQKEYNKLTKRLPRKEKPVPIELQQIWLQDLERIDRCTTCHLGMNNNELTDAPLPLRTHSKMYHDPDEFGCSICHGGQGLATEYSDVHLATESWDEPVMPNRYLESSCGRCHIRENLKDTPILNHGRKSVQELKCSGCHDHPEDIFTFTPSLDGIGSKVVERNWIFRWLKNPKALRPRTKMPNFILSDRERNILADFLMHFNSFTGNVRLDPLPDFYPRRKYDEDFIDLGKTLFRESPCTSCHILEDRGGKLATDLSKVASKAKEIWIYNFIKNPRLLQPDIEMTQFGFSHREVASITAYISSAFIDWDAPKKDPSYESLPNTLELGQSLFYQYNCGGCHQLSEVKIAQYRGPDHSSIGSKKIYQIWFGETSIPQSLHDYIDTKLKSPRIFGETMRMPNFDLSDETRQAITTYLLSLREEDLPQKIIRRGPLQRPFNPQGKIGQIVKNFSCIKCHTIQDYGGTVAPDLTLVGSRLHRDWIEQFLIEPISRRPLVEERMLNLHIPDDEIETLTAYFYTVLLDDSLSVPNDWNPSPDARDRGNRLFWEQYGCQSCHMVDGNGGYLGPPLDDVGDRLQIGWMIHWILDPQKYIPDTIEPRSGMSMREAQDVVAYLMTL